MRKVFCFIQCAFLALCAHTMESVQSLSKSKYQEAMDDLSKKIRPAKGDSNLSETEPSIETETIALDIKSLIIKSYTYKYCIKYKEEIETKFKGINTIDEETWEGEIGPVMKKLRLLLGFIETFCDFTEWCDDELMELREEYTTLRDRLGNLKRGCYHYIKDLEDKGFTTPSEEKEGYVLIDISYHKLVEYALKKLQDIDQPLRDEITKWISYSSEEFKQHVIPGNAKDRTTFFRIASLDKSEPVVKDDLRSYHLIQECRNEGFELEKIVVFENNEVSDNNLIELLKAIIENPVGEARIRSLILLSKLQKAGLLSNKLFMNNKKEISDYVWVYGDEGDGTEHSPVTTLRGNTLALGTRRFQLIDNKDGGSLYAAIAPSHIHELSHAYHAELGIASYPFPTEEYKKVYQSDSDPALQRILKNLSGFETEWDEVDEALTIMGVGIYHESGKYYKIKDSINENSAYFCWKQKNPNLYKGYRTSHGLRFEENEDLDEYYKTNWNTESNLLEKALEEKAKRAKKEYKMEAHEKNTKDQIEDITKK